ncbi:MAG TPA: GNAT family protein [Pirellulales bacterium]|nr:GNAT family protein [Pirellulales bacterium]
MTHAVDVYLRELERRDLERLNAWRNDAEIAEGLGNNGLFISRDVDEQWFQHYMANRDRAVRLAIVVKDSDEYIGNVNLTSIHPVNRSAEFSILIGERRYWGRGIGRSAGEVMLRHAFLDLNLHRVHLSVLSGHDYAIRLYHSLGFVDEGTARECVFKHGRFHDQRLMAILKTDYDRRRA